MPAVVLQEWGYRKGICFHPTPEGLVSLGCWEGNGFQPFPGVICAPRGRPQALLSVPSFPGVGRGVAGLGQDIPRVCWGLVLSIMTKSQVSAWDGDWGPISCCLGPKRVFADSCISAARGDIFMCPLPSGTAKLGSAEGRNWLEKQRVDYMPCGSCPTNEWSMLAASSCRVLLAKGACGGQTAPSHLSWPRQAKPAGKLLVPSRWSNGWAARGEGGCSGAGM